MFIFKGLFCHVLCLREILRRVKEVPDLEHPGRELPERREVVSDSPV